MPASPDPRFLAFAEADDEGYIVMPAWTAKALGLRPDQRRLAMYPDGRIDLAHQAGPDTELLRFPEGWREAGPAPAV